MMYGHKMKLKKGRNRMSKVAVCIPAYNEGAHIAEVITSCLKYKIPVIVIDDCSTDNTVLVAENAGAVVLKHETNKGKGGGMNTAIQYCIKEKIDAAIFLDGDGQHNPESIPDFICAFETQNADMVLGNRMNDVKDMPFLRWAVNALTSYMVSMLAKNKIHDVQVGYRLIRANIWETLDIKAGRFDTEPEMVLRAGRSGYKLVEVPVETIYADEVSSIHPWRDTIRFLQMWFRNFGWKPKSGE